jgi:SAM-dependent methyltransferase
MSHAPDNFWNDRYSSAAFAYGTAPNDFLAAQAGQLPPRGKILCLAEGEGRNAVWLAERGFRVTAVDASNVGLKKAQRLAAERGVTIATVCADLADFDIAAYAWDGIVSIFCHLPPALRATVHRACVAGLAPGGVLLLEGYTPRQLGRGTGGPQHLDMLMEPDDLRRELIGLELVQLQELERDVVEGNCHTGRGAVVQLVAVKR